MNVCVPSVATAFYFLGVVLVPAVFLTTSAIGFDYKNFNIVICFISYLLGVTNNWQKVFVIRIFNILDLFMLLWEFWSIVSFNQIPTCLFLVLRFEKSIAAVLMKALRTVKA